MSKGRLCPTVDQGYDPGMRRFTLQTSPFVVESILCAWALVGASCSSSSPGIRSSGAGGSSTGGMGLGGSIGGDGMDRGGTGGISGSGGIGVTVTGDLDTGDAGLGGIRWGASGGGGTAAVGNGGAAVVGGIGGGGTGGGVAGAGATGTAGVGGTGMGGSSGSGGMATIDGGEPAGLCLPGATQSDCELCGTYLSSTCGQACPKVDCSVYPVPAECAAVCSGAPCCECQRSLGDEYFWRTPQVPLRCGTVCSDIVSKWTGTMADPSLTACTTASDCTVVGGPGSYCNCGRSLSGCGRGANAAAYRASPAATLEIQYRSSCTQGFDACDCGPAVLECASGTCRVTGWGCCNCRGDAGTGADAPQASGGQGGTTAQPVSGGQTGSGGRGGTGGLSAAGGAAGGTGGSRTGGSSGDGGLPSETEFCNQSIAAECERTATCEGSYGLSLLGNYTSQADCTTGQQAKFCSNVGGLSRCSLGKTYHLDNAQACINGVKSMSCDDFTNMNLPPVCAQVCTGP